MPTPPDPTDRRYTDQELSLILQRATERQAVTARAEGEGLSLAEIQEIAAEVGLSPAEVAVAAAQVRAGRGAKGPRSVYEIALPAPLQGPALDELFDAARDRTGSRGVVKQEAGGATWTATDGFGITRVAVTNRGGRSTLAVSENRTGSAVGAVGGGVVAGVLATPIAALLLAGLLGAGLLPLVLGVVLGVVAGGATAALLLRRLASKWRQRTDALGAELARVAMGLVTRGGAEGAPRLPGAPGGGP